MTLSLLFILFGCSKSNTEVVNGRITNMPPYGSRIMTVFGDSIASGYGLESQDSNYVNIFAENIGAKINNFAVNGYESKDLLELLKSEKNTNNIVSSNIIILSVGGNDILHNKEAFLNALKNSYLNGGEDFPEAVNKVYSDFSSNLRECITIIQQINPTASIIIQTVYNPFLNQGLKISIIDLGKLANKYIDKLNESIKTTCFGLTNVHVFDITERMNDNNENFYNISEELDIHPSVQGHETLAEIFTNDFNLLVK